MRENTETPIHQWMRVTAVLPETFGNVPRLPFPVLNSTGNGIAERETGS
jgi:hypothetical protein